MKESKVRTIISPSNLDRVINCPGSAWLHGELYDELPKPTESEDASAGTGKHEILSTINIPYTYKQAVEEAKKFDDDVVKSSILELGAYLESLIAKYDSVLEKYDFASEQRVQITENMRGTADILGLLTLKDNFFVIVVADYKTGQGIEVQADNNFQLLAYAIGAIIGHDIALSDIAAVEVAIIQPVLNNFNQTTYSQMQLRACWQILDAGVRAVHAGRKMFKAGKHCQFCPVISHCPELRRQASETKLVTLGDGKVRTLPNPSELKPSVGSKVSLMRTTLVSWIEAVDEFVRSRLDAEDPQYTELIEYGKGRSLKYWNSDEDRISERLIDLGLDPFVQKLKTPAAVLKEVGEKDEKHVEELIEVKTSKKPINPKKDLDLIDDFKE